MDLAFNHHILPCQVWARGSKVTSDEHYSPYWSRSGIPDIPHWIKRLYKHDEDRIPLIWAVWGFLNPERWTLNRSTKVWIKYSGPSLTSKRKQLVKVNIAFYIRSISGDLSKSKMQRLTWLAYLILEIKQKNQLLTPAKILSKFWSGYPLILGVIGSFLGFLQSFFPHPVDGTGTIPGVETVADLSQNP